MGINGIDWSKKIEAVEKYKRGEGSRNSIAREYGVAASSLWLSFMGEWLHLGLELGFVWNIKGPTTLACNIDSIITINEKKTGPTTGMAADPVPVLNCQNCFRIVWGYDPGREGGR